MPDQPTGLIKICGLTQPAHAEVAVEAGADLIGLVFVKASPRYVSEGDASQIVAAGRPARSVGLFGDDHDTTEIAHIAAQTHLDLIQLHGRKTETLIESVAEATGLPVIAARPIAQAEDLVLPPRRNPDIWLFDAKPPHDETVQGGHGTAFDWSLLKNASLPGRWLLAGGLTPETVATAAEEVRDLPGFCGVDVSSGVEARRGVKDPARIRAFVAAARAAMPRG